MLRPLVIACFAFMFLTIPAAGKSLQAGKPLYVFADKSLENAARQMKFRDYSGAAKLLRDAPAGGTRDFLQGMAAFRSSRWNEAADALGRAAATFPLLADYALADQATALHKGRRFAEAEAPLSRLLKNYPDSPLRRSAALLLADTYYETGQFEAARRAYQGFIETYPAGSDAVTALYRAADCAARAGDTAAAVASFRRIWLSNPASPLAGKAENELHSLAATGVKLPPYSPEELYRRATTLYDLRKYPQAVAALKDVPRDGLGEEMRSRLQLKTGQALFKCRRYKEAGEMLSALLAAKPAVAVRNEALLWQARVLDKNGKQDEAVTACLRLAADAPAAELADDALLEAAGIRKSQGRHPEALAILQQLLRDYPRSGLKKSATWDVAWLSYRSGDMAAAAASFKKLTENDATREKAFYWLGRALLAGGDSNGAKTAFNELAVRYPYGFYTLACGCEPQPAAGAAATRPTFPALPEEPAEMLPVPEGYERVKALIAFGLTEEAEKELAASRKKGLSQKALTALARLYLEMENYNVPLSLITAERPARQTGDPLYAWALSYPLGFRDAVKSQATARGVAENLLYAVIRSESSFSPTALSPAGAVGLMQLMPSTAAMILGDKGGATPRDRLVRPEVNISAGSRHLKDLITSYNGNIVAAVAAYNAGSGNVDRWLKRFGALPPEEFIESIPFGETREYVKKVIATATIYNRLYGLGAPLPLDRGAAPPTAAREVSPPAPVTHAPPESFAPAPRMVSLNTAGQ